MIGAITRLQIAATRTRTAAGSYGADGTWTPGASTPTSITVTKPQSIAGDDLKLLPDGERASNYQVVWTASDLQTTDTDSSADVLTVGGVDFKVFAVWDRVLEGGFYRAILRELKANE